MEHTSMTDTADFVYFNPADCWFHAPKQRTAAFFHQFGPISKVLQQTLREKAPEILFTDGRGYDNLDDGYPMIVYRASRPCSVRTTNDFTYDVLDNNAMNRFFRLAARRLPELLAEMHAALIAAGDLKTAAQYHPKHADEIIEAVRNQKRFQKPLFQMLITEARLLNELAELAGCPDATPKMRARKKADFAKKWNSILRRFYGSKDLRAAGHAVLAAVTEALLSPAKQQTESDDAGTLGDVAA